MPVSIVQIGVGNFGSSASAGIGGYSTAPTKGNRLIAACAIPADRANVNTPTGWTLVGAGSNNPGNNGCFILFTKISAGTESSFTVSWSTTTGNWSIVSYELTGVTTALSGGDRSNAQAGTSVTTITCTNAAASQLPDEFAICGVAALNSMGALVSGPTGGFTDDTSGGSNTGNFLWCSSKVLSATETSSTAITWTTARNVGARLQTFKGMSLDGPWPVIVPSS